MSDFISTLGGKIINLNVIAFLTFRTRHNPEGSGESGEKQIVVGFSAASTIAQGSSMMPLSLVLQGVEAEDFLDQLATKGIEVKHLRAKLA
ncbi:hypothetical protein N9Z18_00090 [Verrucomicrobiales bacterium]|nr:hypothetical protein [Verrucomicrobiales bacterium]MDB4358618.1 hypothetical protein [Verrucomicrobiales bacterium]